MTIQVEMHDRLVMTLQDELTHSIVKHRARGVLIDISALEIVDSFIGRALGDIASMARSSTPKPSWSACGRPSRSPWWSWG